MELRDKSVLDLFINGEPAVDSLKKLDIEMDALKKQQKSLKKELEMQDLDPSKKAELIQQYKEVSDKIQDTAKASQMLRREMDMEQLSITELKKLLKDYTKEWQDATDPAVRDAMKERIDTVNDRLRELGVNVRGQQGMWSNLKDWITGAFVFDVVQEGLAIIKNFVVESIENFKKYDAAAAELSANTNIIGDGLEFLKSKAKEVGPQLGKTADEMLKAYQLMGSAKSDLTANAEALDNVTRAAVTLSQAGKISLEDATTVMAASLNQFNAPAEDAGRFINVISAGAQVGAAEIKDMGAALKASGTVAAAMNVSFEETNGVLQSLSTINIKGEQAGTAFRNILIKMASTSDELNPKVVGLEKALDNLGKQNYTTAEMAKLFGTENVVAAEYLAKHREQVTTFTKALTDTDAAYQMAAKNNDTYEFKMQQSEAKVANLGVALGEKLSPFILKGATAWNSFLDVMGDVVEGSTPLFDAISMWWDAMSGLLGTVGKLIGVMFGLDEKSNTTQQVMKYLGVVFGTVGAAAAALVSMIQLIIDGMLVLSGKISFDQLKDNAVNNFNNIKAGLKATFVDSFKEMEGPSAQAAGNMTKAQGDAQKKIAAQTAKDIADNETATHRTILTKKEEQEEKHRQSELAKADKKNKKEQEDRLKANEDANKAIERASIAAITDEQTRKKRMMAAELEEKIAANKASKADDLVKLNYEIALRNQYKNEVEKLEDDYRKKNIAEEQKRIQTLYNAEAKKAEEVKTLEYNTHKTTLETKLSNENLNINDRKRLNIELQTLIYNNELQRIDKVAQDARNTAFKTSAELMKLAGDDANKKTQIETQFSAQLRAINNSTIADKTAANAKYQEDIKAIEKKTLEQRQANQKSFFDALSALMKGDYTVALDYLNKKWANEKAANNAELQMKAAAAQNTLQMASQVVGALTQLNTAYLNRRINQINQEKNTALAALKNQYDKGVISKSEYEKKVAQLSKEAADKEKEEKLKAWKREQALQIAMAIINAAVAAVKSLAMMGWPLGLIGVAGAAIAAAIQISIIKSQQPPSFKRGGYVKNGGVPEGPRHGSEYGASGLGIWNRETGEEVGEMEGGEPIMILSRETYRNNKPLVDGLIHSSLHANGAPVRAEKGALFQDGGTYGDFVPNFSFPKGKRYDDGRPAFTYSNSTPAGTNGNSDFNSNSNGTAVYVGDDPNGSDYNYNSAGEYTSAADSVDGGAVDGMTANANSAMDESMSLMKEINDTLKTHTNILNSIASTNQQIADKPPVTVNQITQTQSRASEVSEASRFE